jgi:hypothetical protein
MADSKISLFWSTVKSENAKRRLKEIFDSFDRSGLDTGNESRYHVPKQKAFVRFRVPLSNGKYFDIYSDGKVEFKFLPQYLTKDDWGLHRRLRDLIPHPNKIKDFTGYQNQMFPFGELDEPKCQEFTTLLAWIRKTDATYVEQQSLEDEDAIRSDERVLRTGLFEF